MRILFIIQKLYNGGAERAVSRLTSALGERHEVYLALTDPDPYRNGRYDLSPAVHVLPVGQLAGLDRFRGRFAAFRRERAKIEALRRIKEEYRFDVSVSFLIAPNYYNVCSASGEAVVISVRNLMSMVKYKGWRETRIKQWYERAAAGRADRLVAVSESVGEDQIRRHRIPREKVRVIYNPVDPDRILAAAKLPPEDEEFCRFREGHKELLITIGRLTEQKAQWQMIRALREIVREHPSAGLVILGTGKLEERLKRTARDNGVAEHVFFAGYRSNPLSYLYRSDLFVMTSVYEGFSNAMLEAMACGLPIVSADSLSGPRELLAPGTAYHGGGGKPQAPGKTYPGGDGKPTVQGEAGYSGGNRIEYAEYGVLTPLMSGDPGLNDGPLEEAERLFARAVSDLLDDGAMRESYREKGLLRIRDYAADKIAGEWEQLFTELRAGK